MQSLRMLSNIRKRGSKQSAVPILKVGLVECVSDILCNFYNSHTQVTSNLCREAQEYLAIDCPIMLVVWGPRNAAVDAPMDRKRLWLLVLCRWATNGVWLGLY